MSSQKWDPYLSSYQFNTTKPSSCGHNSHLHTKPAILLPRRYPTQPPKPFTMNQHHAYSYLDPTMLPAFFSSAAPSVDDSPALMDGNNICSPPLSTLSSSSPPYSFSLPSYFLHSPSTKAKLQPFSPLCSDFPDSSVRHVFSSEDLQVMNGTQTLGDSCQDGVPISGRVGRYSAEERKERIERYRSKRNQRNFQKKITYTCRKTLADSRPRVRGRFARNGETETDEGAETELTERNCSYDYGNCHNNCDSYDNSSEPLWRVPQIPAIKEEAEVCRYDEEDEMWATFLNGFSMNLK